MSSAIVSVPSEYREFGKMKTSVGATSANSVSLILIFSLGLRFIVQSSLLRLQV
jgi:hypothetical protein